MRPSSMMSPSAIRTPRSAIAMRRSFFTHQVRPGSNTFCTATPFSATPMSNAITIAGTGNTMVTSGVVNVAVTATATASAMPGARRCRLAPSRRRAAMVWRLLINHSFPTRLHGVTRLIAYPG